MRKGKSRMRVEKLKIKLCAKNYQKIFIYFAQKCKFHRNFKERMTINHKRGFEDDY